jgi:hypothetical protein
VRRNRSDGSGLSNSMEQSEAKRQDAMVGRSGLRRFAGTPVIVHDQLIHLNYRPLPSPRSKSPLQRKL